MTSPFNQLRHSACERWLALLILILTMTGFAFGQSPKISPDLQALGPNANANVIVQYNNAPNSNELGVAKAVGAANGKGLGLVKAYAWRMSRNAAQKNDQSGSER